MPEGNGNRDPEDPQDTDPKAGQQHREKGIPAAAAGTGKDFDTDVSDVGGRNYTHHADADVDDIGIACKQKQDRSAEIQNDKAEKKAGHSSKTEIADDSE